MCWRALSWRTQLDESRGDHRKALTTWGEVTDLKHFLPRILELLAQLDATQDWAIDGELIASKLRYADWRKWPADEQDALTQFFLAFRRLPVATTPYCTADSDALCALTDTP